MTALRLALLLVVLCAGCLPRPQAIQSAQLLDRLADARAAFVDNAPGGTQAGCETVGDAQNRLDGEPGLTSLGTVWSSLRQAAEALRAVCDQRTLLAQAAGNSAALAEARQRWQGAIQREIGVACDHLRSAAHALDRAHPC